MNKEDERGNVKKAGKIEVQRGVNSKEELEQVIESIREEYKKKHFNNIKWEVARIKEEETYRVSLTKRSDVLITAENTMDLIKKIKEKYPFEEVEAFVLLSKRGEEV